MKKILFMVTVLMVILSCSITRQEKYLSADLIQEEKLLKQAIVKDAVETGRFRLKLTSLPQEYYYYYERYNIFVDTNTFQIEFLAGPYPPGMSAPMEIFEYKLTPDPGKGYVIEMRCKHEVNTVGNGVYLYLSLKNDGTCLAIFHFVPLSQVYFNYSAGSYNFSGQLESLK